ncbi:MAG: polysaccharide biosynthesis tyrosine autokinase [Nitrospirae bacterium]|nr:polysaccharide biosynthesis tyrosine autokinase [Nitrospirota bacterium]
MPADRSQTASLPDVLRVVRKRKWIVVLTLVASVLVGMTFIRRQTPVYKARATVEFEQTAMSAAGYSTYWEPPSTLLTELEVITSLPVIVAVGKKLGVVPEDVSVDRLFENEEMVRRVKDLQSRVEARHRSSTRIVDIFATSTNPHEARDMANLVASEFKAYRIEQAFSRNTETKAMTSKYQARLEELASAAEEEVSRFRREHGMLGVEASVSMNLNRLSDLEAQGEAVERRLARLNELRALLDDPGALEGDSVPSFEWREAPSGFEPHREGLVLALFEKRDKQLLFTASHPEVLAVNERIGGLVARMRQYLDQARREIEEEGRRIEETRQETETQNSRYLEAEIELGRLQRKSDRYRSMMDSVDEAFQRAQLGGAIQSTNVRIAEYALVPTQPMNKISLLPVASLGLVGLMVGIGLAFLRESFDYSMETVADVESFLHLSVLSVIPHFELRETLEQEKHLRGGVPANVSSPYASTMVVHFFPKAPVSENFQSLRMLLRRKENLKVILVTSATPQEGKSFVSANLALSFAQGHLRTVLVEANTRRPTVQKNFPVENDVGLTNIASEGIDWRTTVKTVADFMYHGLDLESLEASPGLDNFHIINAGPTSVHPPTTLDMLMQRGFLNELREAFDVIIVDSPPTLPVADASVLAPHVDGIVLVYRIGRTARDITQRTLDHLKGSQGKIVGVVLNDVDYQGRYFYSRYSYRYHYRRYAPETDFSGRSSVRKAWDSVTARLARRWKRKGHHEHPTPPEPPAQA